MTVNGSTLINTSSLGQPIELEDRPFSYAIGTQLFLNPTDDPTDSVVSFKVNPTLLTGTLASGESNLAVGFATDSQLNSLSTWTQGFVDAPNGNLFAVGFGRLTSATERAGINVEGVQKATLGRVQTIASVDSVGNTVVINAHPFSTGDRVTISSTVSIPTGLLTDTGFFVINHTSNSIKLAASYANAIAGAEVDLQDSGSGTITISSDEIFTLTRQGSSGLITLYRGDTLLATFSNQNTSSPLRLFYWCREQSSSTTLPLVKEIKVRGAL